MAKTIYKYTDPGGDRLEVEIWGDGDVTVSGAKRPVILPAEERRKLVAALDLERAAQQSLSPLDVVHMGRERYAAAGGHNGAPAPVEPGDRSDPHVHRWAPGTPATNYQGACACEGCGERWKPGALPLWPWGEAKEIAARYWPPGYHSTHEIVEAFVTLAERLVAAACGEAEARARRAERAAHDALEARNALSAALEAARQAGYEEGHQAGWVRLAEKVEAVMSTWKRSGDANAAWDALSSIFRGGFGPGTGPAPTGAPPKGGTPEPAPACSVPFHPFDCDCGDNGEHELAVALLDAFGAAAPPAVAPKPVPADDFTTDWGHGKTCMCGDCCEASEREATRQPAHPNAPTRGNTPDDALVLQGRAPNPFHDAAEMAALGLTYPGTPTGGET